MLDCGIKLAIPTSRTICYVEREVYAAAILATRMEEGWLDLAPVWSDVTTFDGNPWRGTVDILAAGLPCQPYSQAGKQRGDSDERALWPHFVRITEECQPGAIFIENVPKFANYFFPVGRALRKMGYRIKAGFFAAEEVGAPHLRKRLFILAVGDPYILGLSRQLYPRRTINTKRRCELGHPNNIGLQGVVGSGTETGDDGRKCQALFPPAKNDWEGWEAVIENAPHRVPQSNFRRVAYGNPNRVDRIRAGGNTVVPLVAGYAFSTLLSRFKK